MAWCKHGSRERARTGGELGDEVRERSIRTHSNGTADERITAYGLVRLPVGSWKTEQKRR